MKQVQKDKMKRDRNMVNVVCLRCVDGHLNIVYNSEFKLSRDFTFYQI